MKTILTVENIEKYYGNRSNITKAVDNISFSVDEGEFIGVMGPSGSGKTTLLYTISGMDSATAGSVKFFERELTDMSRNEISDLRLEEMGFVFQQMYMLKNLSVYDNIILPAYQSVKGRTKQGRKEINAYAAKLMQKLGISEIADNDVNEVSGGQLQRACICRSLINHPRILFADEPTGALNKQSSHEVMEELNRIHKEGTSILLVTHDMKVASRCDRVLYIEDGNIRDEMQLGAWEDCTDIRKRERRLNEWLITLGW